MAIILIANAEYTEDINKFLQSDIIDVYGGRRKMRLGNSAKKCENIGGAWKKMMVIVQKMTTWGKSKNGLMQMSGLYKFTALNCCFPCSSQLKLS